MDGITPTDAPSPFQPTAALLKALLMHGGRQVQHQEGCQEWSRVTFTNGEMGFSCSSYVDFAAEDRFPNFGAVAVILSNCYVHTCIHICIYTHKPIYI